jgi:hypothetical protein
MRISNSLASSNVGSLAIICMFVPGVSAQNCSFRLVEVSSAGVPGNGYSLHVKVSGDGRWVAFDSISSNLVPGDLNGQPDVFIHDLVTGTSELASLGSNGQQANGLSVVMDVSADGRHVLFLSFADNLDPQDPETLGDVYVRDRQLGITELISVQLTSAPSVHDAGATGSISGDGRFVAFDSSDSNIVAGDSNGYGDVFVRDRLMAQTMLVSVSSAGVMGDRDSTKPVISADGRKVAFISRATNFHPSGPWTDYFHLYIHDVILGPTIAIDTTPSGSLGNGETNEFALSPDGSTVAFLGYATNLLTTSIFSQGFYKWHESTGIVEPFHFANGRQGIGMGNPSLSWDGRFVAFNSQYPYWVAKDPNSFPDIFLIDQATGVNSVVSGKGPAEPANHQSLRTSISYDGSVVGFISLATNLVPGTPPFTPGHAFVRICDPTPGTVFCYPTLSPTGCLPAISAQGQPSASAASGHLIEVAKAVNAEVGLFLYGTAGSGVQHFSNGYLCLSGPLVRTPAQSTGGSLPPSVDCTGGLSIDFNAWLANGADPSLAAGMPVYVQAWLRDPAHPAGALLSDAVAFVVGP